MTKKSGRVDYVFWWRTQYHKHDRVPSAAGSREKITYEGRYNDDGVLEVVPTGKINVYDEIQSHAESVDIYTVLKKFQNGDSTVLAKTQGIYGDFTEMPKSYAEMLNTVIKGEKKFNDLPLEVRSKFNHNFSEFIATAGSPAWFEKMGRKPVPSPTVPKTEVVSSSEPKGGAVNE